MTIMRILRLIYIMLKFGVALFSLPCKSEQINYWCLNTVQKNYLACYFKTKTSI